MSEMDEPLDPVIERVFDNGLMFRPGTEQDRAYFADSIRKVLKQQPYARGLSNDALSMLIDPVLATHKALVLCPQADPAGIIGFCIYRPGSGEGPDQVHPSIAFLQVRKPFRNRGYARDLMAGTGIRPGRTDSPLFGSWPDRYPKRVGELVKYRLQFRPWDFLEIVALVTGRNT